ncbi:MAG: hypothetical protein RL017_136, partial [Pseudomonadota bacterium]
MFIFSDKNIKYSLIDNFNHGANRISFSMLI